MVVYWKNYHLIFGQSSGYGRWDSIYARKEGKKHRTCGAYLEPLVSRFLLVDRGDFWPRTGNSRGTSRVRGSGKYNAVSATRERQRMPARNSVLQVPNAVGNRFNRPRVFRTFTTRTISPEESGRGSRNLPWKSSEVVIEIFPRDQIHHDLEG